MNYRCPQCSRALSPRGLFFHDISTCSQCGQKVVLGDFLAFSVAALTMVVAALTALYALSYELDQYFVAAGYAVSIGMLSGLLVLFLLGRATPFRRMRVRRPSPQVETQAAGRG
jgi:DNA-directed RNA polymerase subunit RPC12/RpoP